MTEMADISWLSVVQIVVNVLTVIIGGVIGGLIVVGAAALWDKRPR
jgi:formate/nitrite transporter FocA (FNT family)